MDQSPALAPTALSPRKQEIRAFADRMAADRDRWIERNRSFYQDDWAYMRFLVPEGQKVLELGCGTGQLLAALKPSLGIGVDLSPAMLDKARAANPDYTFIEGDIENPAVIEALAEHGPFDAIILSDTIGYLEDCQQALANLHRLCGHETRIVVAYYSKAWEPILSVGETLGVKMPHIQQNWLSSADIANLLQLADFDTIKRDWRQLLPRRLLGLGTLINRYLGTLPVLRRACLRNYVVARSLKAIENQKQPSLTVLIPCRNEAGNIEPAVTRLPKICDDLEIMFVEGNSQDNTVDEIKRVIAAYPHLDIKFLQQDGKGKGDAVRKGFAHARGDILMILDADLTVPPEDLPKFYDVLASGKCEFVNGTRLVYPMEKEAMRFLNTIANHGFSILFSWLLNSRFTDTLCGTKGLYKKDYEKIVAGRSYFGDFDPFGDFDLIFGASKQNLKILEVPIRYAARTYGSTQISRFADGWLLIKMVLLAYRKLKAW